MANLEFYIELILDIVGVILKYFEPLFIFYWGVFIELGVLFLVGLVFYWLSNIQVLVLVELEVFRL